VCSNGLAASLHTYPMCVLPIIPKGNHEYMTQGKHNIRRKYDLKGSNEGRIKTH
jgi:hypothetical protein